MSMLTFSASPALLSVVAPGHRAEYIQARFLKVTLSNFDPTRSLEKGSIIEILRDPTSTSWYTFWRRWLPKPVGFILYCPAKLGVHGNVKVSAVIETVEKALVDPTPVRRYRGILFRLARDLNVVLP